MIAESSGFSREEYVKSYCLENGIPIMGFCRGMQMLAVGVQFHPEAAATKHLRKIKNANDFMDYEMAMKCFRYLINYLHELNNKSQAA